MIGLKAVKEIIKQLQEGNYIKIDSKGIISTDEYIIIKKDETKGITLSSVLNIVGSSGVQKNVAVVPAQNSARD